MLRLTEPSGGSTGSAWPPTTSPAAPSTVTREASTGPPPSPSSHREAATGVVAVNLRMEPTPSCPPSPTNSSAPPEACSPTARDRPGTPHTHSAENRRRPSILAAKARDAGACRASARSADRRRSRAATGNKTRPRPNQHAGLRRTPSPILRGPAPPYPVTPSSSLRNAPSVSCAAIVGTDPRRLSMLGHPREGRHRSIGRPCHPFLQLDRCATR